MSRSIVCRFAGVLALLVAVVAMPVTTLAGPGSEPFLERLLDTGASAFSLGVSEPSFRWDLGSVAPSNPGAQASERARPLDAEARGKAISFDLKLKWPGAETTPMEPYLAVGPALLLSEPDSIAALTGTRLDPTVRLGAKVGAGLNWRLGKDTTLFGAYEFTTASPNGRFTVGPKAAGDAGSTGYDLTYGVRFRY
jgi:hypothetical protein